MLVPASRKRYNSWCIGHELALRHWARYDAAQTPPVPDSNSWAPIEIKLGQRFDHEAAAILGERDRDLKSERVAAINNQLAVDERAFPALVHACKAAIYTARLKLNTRWAQVRERAHDRYDDVQAFKREHMLRREAHYHPVILAVGVCAIAFVGETAVNAALFAEVSNWGLYGGALNAMTLSLPNVALGLAAGFWGLRAREHIRPLIHHTGTIVTIASLSLAVLWTWYVGHLRLLAERVSHGRQELRLSDWRPVRAQILDDPTAPFMSSQAVVLMLAGLFVFAVALWDGRDGFSDRYPGFARVDRRWRRALRDVEAFKRSIFRVVKRATRRGIRSVKQQRRDARGKTREALLILDRARGTIVKYQTRIDEKLWAHRECLSEYQTLNGRHRPDAPPARFELCELPGTRAMPPVYDWQAARAEIHASAERAADAAAAAIAELEQHRLSIMAAVEAESAQVTRAPALVPPPPLLTFAPASV